MKGLSQVLGLNLILFYGAFKPTIWLSPLVNTGPVILKNLFQKTCLLNQTDFQFSVQTA